MLAELPLQEAGAHLLAGDLAAAAAALQHGTAPAAQLPSWMSSAHPPLRPGWRSCKATWCRPRWRWAGSPGLPRNTMPSAHGLGRILAGLIEAGIHLERRQHQAAAALLTSARAAARDQRPPGPADHGRRLDRPAGHGSGGPGGCAGVFGPGPPGPRLRPIPGSGHSSRSRNSASRSPWSLPKRGVLIPRLPANRPSGLLRARLHVVRREWANAEEILAAVEPVTIRERVEWGVLRSLACTSTRPRAGPRLPPDSPRAGQAPRVPGHHHRAGTRHRRPAPFPAGQHRPQALRR